MLRNLLGSSAAIAVLLAAPSIVLADPPLPLRMSEGLSDPHPKPAPPIFYSDLAAGYVRTSGNADTTSLNATMDVVYKSRQWENTFNATAIDARSAGVTTAEQYDLTNKLLYNLDPLEYLFNEADYDNDRFAGVAERYALSFGYGRHLINTPKQTLDIDAGVGANRTREQFTYDYQNRPIFTAGGTYLIKFSSNSQFQQTLRTEISNNNTFIDPIATLKVKFVGNVFGTLNYELRYNTNVPAGTLHTDQVTSINIGYTLGNKPKNP